ncbi:hypothetical protein [uncultured Pseudonocardia sp.]|uniref:hypothetical protein n=1 Tax=uncultured Pseudonocardia sp. TaxID=211455 RepID=UPI00261D7449|nr:hypothetical protein [uncultured Pseudonocardia sp.]
MVDGGDATERDDSNRRPLIVAPRLERLPLHELPWERYEALLRRIAQDDRGLRNVRLYGVRGQSQYGIDIAGQAADGTGEAIQTKRYQTFTAADLTAAVDKFIAHRAEIPFPVARLFVAAACDADQRQVTDELYRLIAAHPDVEIDFWDQRTQCDMLRRRRDIVAEFFGDHAVDSFCYPAPLDVVPTAPPDRVVLADAMLRGPADVTGAQLRLARADRLQATEPARAAEAVQDAIELLRNGGFAAHAIVLVPRRAELLQRAGRHDEGVRLLSDEFWRAIDVPDQDEAHALTRGMRADDSSPTSMILASIAEHALMLLRQPFGAPDIPMDAVDDAVLVEHSRLALLAAQAAAIDPGCAWTTDNATALSALADRLETLADGVIDDDGPMALAVALRTEVADVTGEWTTLLGAARRHRPSRSVAAHVLARYAMHVAERGGHGEADEAWADAVEQACLTGEHAHAAEWVHARRVLSSRQEGINSEFAESHRLARALYSISGGPPHQLERLRERALRAIVDGKPHVAVPALRSLLRIAHACGWWGEVIDARLLLANAYGTGAEPTLSADLLIAAGQASAAEELARTVGDLYLDVRHHLGQTPAYWIPAAAFRVIATQADIVPDDHVAEIVDTAIEVLHRAEASTLADSPLLAPSVLLDALKALAALAPRLSEPAAAAALDYLAPSVPRSPNSSRYTDDSHVQLCISIAETHESLRAAALTQLLDLLAAADSGVSQRVEHDAVELFRQHRTVVIERLRDLETAGNLSASALVVLLGEVPGAAQIADAADLLARPSRNTAESIGFGTDAVRQSQLAIHVPPEQRRRLIALQLDRVAAPYEPGDNRADYLLAATNLSVDLDDTAELFRRAITVADDANPSPGDLICNIGNHPLGTFRVSGLTIDTRPHATFLAATLARTPEQHAAVRARALNLLSVPGSGYFAVRALQRLSPADLLHDLPLLIIQPDWAARSLGAITWATTAPSDPTIGLALARDIDVRVRRALAQALSGTEPTPTISKVIAELTADAHFSVRSLLNPTEIARSRES